MLLAASGGEPTPHPLPKTLPFPLWPHFTLQGTHAPPPCRFEDPLLAMPSFRRSGGSPTLDLSALTPVFGGAQGACLSPTVLSPALRGGLSNSNSFSARRSHIDFRRSVPGAATPAAAVSSPGEVVTSSRSTSARREGSLSRGALDYGSADLMGYSSLFVGSESGGPGERLKERDQRQLPVK